MQDLKADLIQRIEQTIDVLRKDEERFKTQLAEIEPQLEEARAMLQLIKTGKTQVTPNGARRKITRREDALEALKLFSSDQEFVADDYADVLEISVAAAAAWLKKFGAEGILVKTQESIMTPQGRRSAVWKVK